jgi:hypothetical protein
MDGRIFVGDKRKLQEIVCFGTKFLDGVEQSLGT